MSVNTFRDKTLLITGGTGTFGNAVLRRFLTTDIREIRVFSRDEKKQDDMRLAYNNRKLKFYIGDVRRPESLLRRDDGRGLRLPRRRPEAGAFLRVLSDGGAADQQPRRRERDERRRGGRRQAGRRAQHRQGRLPHQRHGHLQGDDGEADGGQVARGRRTRLHDLPSPATAT